MTETTWPYCASFPISGRIVRPSAADYAAEGERLREAACLLQRVSPRGWPRLYELARMYRRLARRKQWAEDTAAQRVKHAEAA